jgi:hypothetical protein
MYGDNQRGASDCDNLLRMWKRRYRDGLDMQGQRHREHRNVPMLRGRPVATHLANHGHWSSARRTGFGVVTSQQEGLNEKATQGCAGC